MIEEKIEFLEECANLYETSGKSPISDEEYDDLYNNLKSQYPEHPFFSKVGGMDVTLASGFKKVKHKYIMGSLNKDPNPVEFGKWFEKTFIKKNVPAKGVLQLKVDGSSFCLKYENGLNFQSVSRGDGLVGLDYTKNGKNVNGVVERIDTNDYVEVKGEIYKNKKDFIEQGWHKEYANARNFTAGAINQKDPDVTLSRGLDFVAYEVRGIKFETEYDKIDFLIRNGFNTLKEYSRFVDFTGMSVGEVVDEIRRYMDSFNRDNLPFDVDGVVFKVYDIALGEEMGTTDGGKIPKSSRAIKFPTEKKETFLKGIEWSVGRTGALTPVGLLQPVHLAGTTVSRVSLHNMKELSENLKITKLNARVKIQKSGDIIPKVLEACDGDGEPIILPDFCPSCNEKVVWDSTHTTKVCHSPVCPAQLNSKIEHWFKTIGVMGIGIGIITKLTSKVLDDNGNVLVSSISDMYNLKNHKDRVKSFFGNKAGENIINSVESVKSVSLDKFIEALGIANIGRMSKDIARLCSSINDVCQLKQEDIEKIEGFGGIKAKNFIDGWKAGSEEIQNIAKNINIETFSLTNDKLVGKKFCFTGSFKDPTRSEMEKMVESNGGKVASVSKNLTALVWDEKISGSKIEKAKKLNIPIITQQKFMSFLED